MQTNLNRLETLEHSLKKQRRLTLTLAGALVALTTLAAADKITAQRATSFTLEDRQGKPRATLALDESQVPTLTFMTQEGIITRTLGPHDETPMRLAELERILNTIPRIQATGGGGLREATLAGDTQYRLNDLERESTRQRDQLIEQQRLNAQAQDQQRLFDDQRRRDHERLDTLRRNDRLTQP